MLASDNPFPSILNTEQASTPTAPAAGKQRLFIKTSDHRLYRVDSAGTVVPIETGTGGWTVISVTDTGTKNDYAPSGLAGNTLIRCNNATALTITGFANPVDGQRLCLVSVGAGTVSFTHNATSTLANRLQNFVTSGPTVLAAGSGVAEYQYDTTTQRWRLTDHTQGAWLAPGTPTFAGNGAMTWTGVTAVGSAFYEVKGRTIHWYFDYSGTIGGTPNTQLKISIPNGYTANNDKTGLAVYLTGGVPCLWQSNGTNLLLYADVSASGGTWTAGVRRVQGTVTFEIL